MIRSLVREHRGGCSLVREHRGGCRLVCVQRLYSHAIWFMQLYDSCMGFIKKRFGGCVYPQANEASCIMAWMRPQP
jgi:hypothetical protein